MFGALPAFLAPEPIAPQRSFPVSSANPEENRALLAAIGAPENTAVWATYVQGDRALCDVHAGYLGNGTRLYGPSQVFLIRDHSRWRLYARVDRGNEDSRVTRLYDLRALGRAGFSPLLLDTASLGEGHDARGHGLIARFGYLYFAQGGDDGFRYRGVEDPDRFYVQNLSRLVATRVKIVIPEIVAR